jgi:S-adenosylmethionine:diacylglycerol 3-amino-3-carboxypropyl transferase
LPPEGEHASSPWRRGRLDARGEPPELVFGQMYEDRTIELEAFPPRGRVFCIASAGCTAFALAARGDEVTAVDVNPAQVAYVQRRLVGGPSVEGKVEHLLGRARLLAPLLGWRRPELEQFCDLEDVEEQARLWREQLETVRFRLAMAIALRPLALRLAYASEFAGAVPGRFDRVLRGRLERGFRLHPNRHNPYASQLLLGVGASAEPPRGAALALVCADAADYLEGCAPASFDGFTLSNILDGAGSAYAQRLLRAARRAAAPAAVLVLRSLAESAQPEDDRWAARDRSFLWGSIRIERVGGG